MHRRWSRWMLLVTFVFVLLGLSAGSFYFFRWKARSEAEKALRMGIDSYQKKQWQQAAGYLSAYLSWNGKDVPVLLKYAQARTRIRPQRQKNLDNAIGTYRKILRIEPNNKEAVEKLVQIYLDSDLKNEAELVARRYLKENTSSEIQKMLATALAGQRKTRQAAQLLKSVIDDNPGDISAYEQLGMLAEQRQEPFLMSEDYWFELAVKSNPESALAYTVRGAHYLRAGNRDRALSDLETAHQTLNLSDPQVRLRLAEELINADVLNKAIYHLEQVRKQIPQNQKLWQLWARLALKRKSGVLLLWVAKTGAQELASEPWDFMPVCTELLIEAGKLQEAEKNILLMSRKEIAPAKIAYLQGLVAEKQQKEYAAIKHWHQALDFGADAAKTRLKLTDVLIEVGNKPEAIEQLQILLSECPELLEARLLLAELLLDAGNAEDAYEHALFVQVAQPNNLRASLLKIRANMQQLESNGIKETRIDWQKLEDELGNLPDDNIEVLKSRFELSLKRSQFDKAREVLSEIKEQSPDSREAVLTQARLMEALGNSEEAVRILKQFIKNQTFDVDVVQYLAALLVQNNRYEECEQILTGALEKLKKPAEKRKLTLLLSSLYQVEHQPVKRRGVLETYLNSYPDDVVIICELLSCLEIAGEQERAKKLVDGIKTVEGENGRRWRYEQAKFWLTFGYHRKQYFRIMELLEKNLDENAGDYSSKLLLACCYEKNGNTKLASLTYSEALDCLQSEFNLYLPAVIDLWEIRRQSKNEVTQSGFTNEDELNFPELRLKNRLGILKNSEIDKVNSLTRELLKKI